MSFNIAETCEVLQTFVWKQAKATSYPQVYKNSMELYICDFKGFPLKFHQFANLKVLFPEVSIYTQIYPSGVGE